tara:strand:- start:42 stop:689 length:648 start_codon:yes stop_codon:yes gene_type:complete
MAYFDLFPNILIASHTENRNSNLDMVLSKNLFKRAKIREDFFQNVIAFNKFQVEGDDRPDNVADEIYGNPKLDWVVLLSNNIINIHDEWPMSQSDFQRYLDNKYDKVQLTQIHHYETTEIKSPDGSILLEEGQHVDADFTYKYSQDGSNYSVNSVTSVSNYQYEIDKNDAKRSIYVIRKKYLDMIIEDMREIMTYQDSSQYINKRTKKGSDIRLE